MLVKLLNNLVEELAGQETGRIVPILFDKRDVNEFIIAKKMDLTINQVRNILYKLSAEGLVTFIRKKDKRKGWYIYYWTIKTEKCLIKLEQTLKKKIEDLNELLKNRETKRFYVCKSCGVEVTEEKALENGFSCEECAEVYELADNSGAIKDTKEKITRTEKDLELVLGELNKIQEKETKKRTKERKKEEKEIEKKKEIIKAAKAAAKAKLKKVSKKKIVKKTVKKEVSKKKIVKKAIKKKVSKKKIVKKAIKKKKK